MKKIFLLSLLSVGCTGAVFSQHYMWGCPTGNPHGVVAPESCVQDPYVLVFEDNFHTFDSVNTWEIRGYGQGCLENEDVQGYYSLDNVSIVNGQLRITARQETVTRRANRWYADDYILSDGIANLRQFNYTSSNIWTKKKFGYGKFEVSCKIPPGTSFWPAFWLYDAPNGVENEIDIFEFWDYTNKARQNIHYGGSQCGSGTIWDKDVDYSQNFHTYTLEWDEYMIKWYIDYKLVAYVSRWLNQNGQTVDCNGVGGFMTQTLLYPNVPMHIVLNLAIKRNVPNSTTSFPNYFDVEYVRYWERRPCETKWYLDNDALRLNGDLYPHITGDLILAAGNSHVDSGKELKITAASRITLSNDFVVEPGGQFTALIDPEICDGSNAPAVSNTQETNQEITSSGDAVLGTEEPTTGKGIKVSPNPYCSGDFTIETPVSGKVTFINSQGVTVKTGQVYAGRNSLLLEELPSGLYYLRFESTGQTVKLVLTK